MKIESIQLRWFRGAADFVALDAVGKSVVVYGENGSGKSSFVDAVEYLLAPGRIAHLAHEYSGPHQEKGIINTHLPPGEKASARVVFDSGSEWSGVLTADGKPVITRSDSGWQSARSVLRQDEMAEFIHETKGRKYSSLLPLLGLQPLEMAAENLRQLAHTVEQDGELRAVRETITVAEAKRRELLGGAEDQDVIRSLGELYGRYCPGGTATDPLTRCKEVRRSVRERLKEISAEIATTNGLALLKRSDLGERISEVRSSGEQLVARSEPHVTVRLDILSVSSKFAEDVSGPQIECPACGRDVTLDEFKQHVARERRRLAEAGAALDGHRAAARRLSGAIVPAKQALSDATVKSALEAMGGVALAADFETLERVDAERLRTRCGSDIFPEVQQAVDTILAAAKLATEDGKPDAERLANDAKTVDAIGTVLEAKDRRASLAHAELVAGYLRVVEERVRTEIRTRAESVIKEISADIQRMWAILHPSDAVEHVHLYVPADADKAIDIGLRFHGVDQESPRLTLSEGHRNSLGLCVFLAMAKRDPAGDTPVLLDDVVVSLDRNHRGMVAELLEVEFADRQVLLFTHDREWYSELRRQLSQSRWLTKTLRPYEGPALGIRWAEKQWTFDDGRSQLAAAPDAAANTARKIMDIELALLTEKLGLRLPYRHRERNDHRTAHDFLTRLIADGERCFRKLGAEGFERHLEAIEAMRQADSLLTTWGNRGSHSFDVVKSEAEKLIERCEGALDVFTCGACGTSVLRLTESSGKYFQCECGKVRWENKGA